MAGRDRAVLGIARFGLVLALLGPANVGALPLDAVQADRVRIQQHLALVEQRLRDAPVDELAPAVRQARARSLDELHRYWQAGVFPRNSQHPGQRRPYFIDDEGRACAVAALIQRSGYEALARRIDDAFHNDYVPDMLDAELLAWAGAHGFSVAELALIQPEYCACGTGFDAADGVGGQGGAATDPAAYRPVCGSNGLTYWNACIAEVCGGVQIVAEGECVHGTPCELCGTGSRYVAVSECTQDAPEGICDLDFESDVTPVSDKVAARWLELQGRDCQAPDYALPRYEEDDGWQSAQPPGSAPPRWDCVSSSGGASSGGASSGGAPSSGGASSGAPTAAGAATNSETPAQGGQPSPEPGAPPTSDVEASGGCTCSTAWTQRWSGAPLVALALGLLRRRRGQVRAVPRRR